MSDASTDAANSTLSKPWAETSELITSTRGWGSGASREASSATSTRLAP